MNQPNHTGAADQPPAPFPRIRTIGIAAPFGWLSRGLDDLKHCPGPSLFYGACFAVMGLLLKTVFRNAYEYTSALTTGFLLIAPFLAIGLYEISRRRERGETCALVPTITAWRPHVGSIGIYSLILIVIFLVWARASLVIFALFYTREMPTLQGFLQQVLSLENRDFLMVYFGAGLVFAILVFAVSVISIPLMLDRGQDTVTAMIASTLALARNAPTLFLWAALIVALTVVGVGTAYVGLIVTMPLIGHATWHAYRELVE
jgi:uncharacterized membrane protein